MELDELIQIMSNRTRDLTQEWLDERVDWIIKSTAEHFYKDLKESVLSKASRKPNGGGNGYYKIDLKDFRCRSCNNDLYIKYAFDRVTAVHTYIDSDPVCMELFYTHLIRSFERYSASQYGGEVENHRDVIMYGKGFEIKIEVDFYPTITREIVEGEADSSVERISCYVNDNFKKMLSYMEELAKADGILISGPYVMYHIKRDSYYKYGYLGDNDSVDGAKVAFHPIIKIKYKMI